MRRKACCQVRQGWREPESACVDDAQSAAQARNSEAEPLQPKEEKMRKSAPMKLRTGRGAVFALASVVAIGVSGAALAMDPLPDRPQPVANDSGVKAKIAMIGFANNPYWVSVEKGVETANKVLSSRGGQVTWIVAGADINVPTVDQAIRAAATQGYNGIGFFIAGEGNCALVKQMV